MSDYIYVVTQEFGGHAIGAHLEKDAIHPENMGMVRRIARPADAFAEQPAPAQES